MSLIPPTGLIRLRDIFHRFHPVFPGRVIQDLSEKRYLYWREKSWCWIQQASKGAFHLPARNFAIATAANYVRMLYNHLTLPESGENIGWGEYLPAGTGLHCDNANSFLPASVRAETRPGMNPILNICLKQNGQMSPCSWKAHNDIIEQLLLFISWRFKKSLWAENPLAW